jgi:hypothetical protein
MIVIHTDNTATLSGLNKGSIRDPSMEPLRAILLLAAAADIELHGVWLASKDNGLSDALSCFNAASITNRCQHWQDSILIHLPIFRRNQVRHRQNTSDSFGTAWILPPASATDRQSNPTKHSAPLTAMLLGPLQKLYWASGLLPRVFGSSTLQNMGRIQPDTIQVYLAVLRSHHTDYAFDSDVFDSIRIKRLIKGARNVLPPAPKRNSPPNHNDDTKKHPAALVGRQGRRQYPCRLLYRVCIG